MKSAIVLLLAGLSFAGRAQAPATPTELRQHGELTGARPSNNVPAQPRTAAGRPPRRPRFFRPPTPCSSTCSKPIST